MNKNHIEQIKQELDNLAQKRKEIYASIRAVDRLFSGSRSACVICGASKDNFIHRPDYINKDEQHEYIESIYVGNLQEVELVYSIENSADLYITNEGLRFHPNSVDDDERNTLPSEWYAEVRLEILNNLDTIVHGVLLAIKRQSESLKIYDEGITKVHQVLQSLKELA